MSDNTTPTFPLNNMTDFKQVMVEKVKNIFIGFIEEDKLDKYIEETFLEFNENEMRDLIKAEMLKQMKVYITSSLNSNPTWNEELKKYTNQTVEEIVTELLKSPETIMSTFIAQTIQPTVVSLIMKTNDAIRSGRQIY